MGGGLPVTYDKDVHACPIAYGINHGFWSFSSMFITRCCYFEQSKYLLGCKQKKHCINKSFISVLSLISIALLIESSLLVQFSVLASV